MDEQGTDGDAGEPTHEDGGPIQDGAAGHGRCEEALDTLYHFLDGELDDERRRAITVHLEECSPCLEAFDFEAELKFIVAHRCRETVPDRLRQRVADALTEASRTFPGTE